MAKKRLDKEKITMTVKVFTGSGQLTVNKEEPKYIKASGGNESIVRTYEKLSHPFCGTSKCCGQCATAQINKEDDEKND